MLLKEIIPESLGFTYALHPFMEALDFPCTAGCDRFRSPDGIKMWTKLPGSKEHPSLTPTNFNDKNCRSGNGILYVWKGKPQQVS